MSKPIVYLVLGCRGSEQFSIVADLIEFGTDKGERSQVFHATADAAQVAAEFKAAHRETELVAYEWETAAGAPEVSALQFAADAAADYVFIVANSLADPADFVESFHAWLPESGCELGRVLTVLHSDLAVAQGKAREWFECCIHFSDAVLLARRQDVSNKQMQVFLDHFEEECYPCLFVYVKKGRVANPSLVLDTQPRRLTRIFDEPEIFEDDEEEDFAEEAIAGDLARDPYLKRVSGGRRARPVSPIGPVLEGQ